MGENRPSRFSSLIVGVTDGEITVDDCNVFDALGQVSASEPGVIFRNFLSGRAQHLAQ